MVLFQSAPSLGLGHSAPVKCRLPQTLCGDSVPFMPECLLSASMLFSYGHLAWDFCVSVSQR